MSKTIAPRSSGRAVDSCGSVQHGLLAKRGKVLKRRAPKVLKTDNQPDALVVSVSKPRSDPDLPASPGAYDQARRARLVVKSFLYFSGLRSNFPTPSW